MLEGENDKEPECEDCWDSGEIWFDVHTDDGFDREDMIVCPSCRGVGVP